jgi:uncharacterized protein (TIGR03118 family)
MAPCKRLAAVAVLAAAAAAGPTPSHAQTTTVTQTNLVANLAGVAPTLDKNLQNPWGIANTPGGALWISDNNAGLSTLYTGTGSIVPLVVKLPPAAGETAGSPTGIVWNPAQGQFEFVESGTTVTSTFIFDSEDGQISAWAPIPGQPSPTTATVVVDNSKAKAVYKGLAFGTNVAGNFIFATNFHAGTVEAYDKTFTLTALKGSFSDPGIPKSYAPFGIQNIDGDLFVTYGKQDAAKHDEVFGAGFGFVDVFSTEGVLIKRFATRGVLNAPWGVVRAPYGFGSFAGKILVGNFGDGWINSFRDIGGGGSAGPLTNSQGAPIVIPGLWGLVTGSGSGTDPDALYFTAGPNNETNGVFGSLTATVSTTAAPGGSGW